MKFIADENLGSEVPKCLRGLGIDIIAAADMAAGKPDPDILSLANNQRRILITLDKDFGELVFKEGLIHPGVILLRLRDESIDNKKKILLKILNSKQEFTGKFTVIREKVVY
ncbi:MAG: DUF5615 family PIN-like protein [Candidatus Daviesbacteria bacterium]|nr:DUF5615 family PIN-like protein [Candidatus Daviesbacteria bacterium]